MSEIMTVFHCAAISFLLMSVPRWVTSRPQATLNSASDTPASSIIVFGKSPVEKPTSISIMMTSTEGTQPFVTFASISEMANTSSSAVNAPKAETIIGFTLHLSPH